MQQNDFSAALLTYWSHDICWYVQGGYTPLQFIKIFPSWIPGIGSYKNGAFIAHKILGVLQWICVQKPVVAIYTAKKPKSGPTTQYLHLTSYLLMWIPGPLAVDFLSKWPLFGNYVQPPNLKSNGEERSTTKSKH
jgi:hypothetical protein